MEDGPIPESGSRLRATHTRSQNLQRASRIEGGPFPKCLSRLSAAHIIFLEQKIHSQERHGLRRR
eukprot:1186652-Pyramimonas_sp.AAC.1